MAGGSTDAFANRLRKNARHFHKWAKARGLTAYRLYDRDMPEFPYAVDWYDGRVQLTEYAAKRVDEELRGAALKTVMEVLGTAAERVFLKTRTPKVWGAEQYQRLGRDTEPFTVEEQGLRFWVDLSSHIDTGLFLDHRLTRARVREESGGKRVLNLFAYTGAFTVYAAAGGARATTSVDLSNTYLDQARRNLELNHLAHPRHALIRADVRAWLVAEAARSGTYELIVLDPPSFSTSKAMRGTFDIQRDQAKLLRETLAVLASGGTLYFSTNFRGFELSAESRELAHFEELTPRTLPDDFRQKDVHRCWKVSARSAGPR